VLLLLMLMESVLLLLMLMEIILIKQAQGCLDWQVWRLQPSAVS